MDEARRARLAEWLAAELGATLCGAALLSGGAIQQNWALDLGDRALVLRTDSAATLAQSRTRAEEFALLRAAFAAGVTVPEPITLCLDASVIGAPFFLMARAPGIAAGHRVVRSDTLGGGREAAARAMGRELARLHAIRPPREDLGFLGEPPPDAAQALVAGERAALDRQAVPRPALEWGLRHLERTAPAPVPAVLCHNDFRTGNILWTEAGLSAVLDWEFAAWGDGHADLGWLCARCWRFGNSGMEAGGVGPRAALYAGYAEAGGGAIDDPRVRWWELAAHLRWAVIAIDQAGRFLSGAEPSLELALTGHIVPELEWEILRMVEARDAA